MSKELKEAASEIRTEGYIDTRQSKGNEREKNFQARVKRDTTELKIVKEVLSGFRVEIEVKVTKKEAKR